MEYGYADFSTALRIDIPQGCALLFGEVVYTAVSDHPSRI
jgi:hypothetical protein